MPHYFLNANKLQKIDLKHNDIWKNNETNKNNNKSADLILPNITSFKRLLKANVADLYKNSTN